MKVIILALFFIAVSLNSFSQHQYENPRQKQKRGLLEEPLEEKEVVKEDTAKPISDRTNSKLNKKQLKYCACEKTYYLSLKRLKLYNQLVSSDVLNNDVSVWTKYDQHKRKSSKAMKMIRGKYEIDQDLECEHDDLTFKKMSQYKNEIAQLTDVCDIDIITER